MLAHIHIMKTAGQTVCDILRASFGADHCDIRSGAVATRADIDFARRFYPRLRSIAGHGIRPRGDLVDVPSIRFFTFLRDPVSRCLSHYQFERQRNGKQIEFLPWLEQNANYQTRILTGSENAEQAIETLEKGVGLVGFVEEFDTSLQLLQGWSGEELQLAYRSRNMAKDETIKADVLADPRNVEAMRNYHTADDLVYRYALDVIWPRQLEKYAVDQRTGERGQNTIPMVYAALKRNLVYKPISNLRQKLSA